MLLIDNNSANWEVDKYYYPTEQIALALNMGVVRNIELIKQTNKVFQHYQWHIHWVSHFFVLITTSGYGQWKKWTDDADSSPFWTSIGREREYFFTCSSNMHHSHHFKINFAHSHMHDTIIPSPISQFQTSEHVKLANTQPLMHYPTPFYLTLHNCFLTTLTESSTRIVVALSKQRLAQHRLSHAVSRSALPRA